MSFWVGSPWEKTFRTVRCFKIVKKEDQYLVGYAYAEVMYHYQFTTSDPQIAMSKLHQFLRNYYR